MRSWNKALLPALIFAIALQIFMPRTVSAFSGMEDPPSAVLSIPYKNEYDVRDFTEKIALYGKASKVPVLMYHHILEAKDKKLKNDLIVTMEEFQSQMEYLYNNDYTTITIRELELFLNNELELPKKSVLITFDDGYKSMYVYAHPILKNYGFKAAIALIPQKMPQETEQFNPWRLGCLSWQEVALGNDVFEYINHTYSHASMKEISKKRALAEINEVDVLLETKYFAYPYGHTSVNSEKALRQLDYKLAFTTRPGFVRKSSARLYLPRQRIFAGMAESTFADLLE